MFFRKLKLYYISMLKKAFTDDRKLAESLDSEGDKQKYFHNIFSGFGS